MKIRSVHRLLLSTLAGLSLLPAELAAAADQPKADGPGDAKVSGEGALLGAYTDEECSLRLEDNATLAVLGEIFFKPALDKGKPVDGTARIRLGEI